MSTCWQTTVGASREMLCHINISPNALKISHIVDNYTLCRNVSIIMTITATASFTVDLYEISSHVPTRTAFSGVHISVKAPGTTDRTKFCRGRPIKYLSWPDLATYPKSISSGHKGYDTLKMVWRWGRDIKKRYVVGVSQVSRATVVGPS